MQKNYHRITFAINNDQYQNLESWCRHSFKSHSYKLTPFSKHPKYQDNSRHAMFETHNRHDLVLFKLTWLT